jgi:hypothetical protein
LERSCRTNIGDRFNSCHLRKRRTSLLGDGQPINILTSRCAWRKYLPCVRTVRFEDRLTYCQMTLESTNCSFDSTHSVSSLWRRPLKVIGPVRPYTDFEWTVFGDVIISKEICKKLCKAQFSGFCFQSVKFYSTSETPFGRDSVELKVIAWGGHARKESGIELIDECPGCKRRVYSGYEAPAETFDVDEWDGSDAFRIWPVSGHIFITRELRDWAADEQFTGVRFIPLSELPLLDTFTPNPIETWFK